jgi:hypothetical protein
LNCNSGTRHAEYSGQAERKKNKNIGIELKRKRTLMKQDWSDIKEGRRRRGREQMASFVF